MLAIDRGDFVMTTQETFTIEKLAARVDFLERSVRALRIAAGTILVIAVVAVTVWHFQQSRFVATQRFTVQNNQDGLIAMLGVDGNGRPSLVLSSDGKARAVLGLKTDGNPYLALSDADGKVRWAVAVDSSGAHVMAGDAAGKQVPDR
jgi:hypothetical protein